MLVVIGMKEGYLQRKIAELSDEIKGFHQKLHMQDEELIRLEERVRGHKELIKRLDDLDSFKEQLTKEIKEEHKQVIAETVEELQEEISRRTAKLIEEKTRVLTQAIEEKKKDEALFSSYVSKIEEYDEITVFLKEFFRLFLLKLINKGVLSVREKEEIQRRAEKKISKKQSKE